MNTYISLLILLQIFNFSYPNNKLIFLYTHFRHGARSPGSLVNSFSDSMGQNWTEVGELTGVGERMHYLLGIRNRQKYIEEGKLLSEKYDPHEMLIYSTNFNRTLISCASQLQGWYPQRVNLGDILNDKQEKNSYPPLLEYNRDEYINNITEELNNSALPYRMMLAPIKIIDEEMGYNIPNLEKCSEKIDEIIKNNTKNSKELNDSINEFINKYNEKLNKYKKYELNINSIVTICDVFTCDYTDGRDFTEFKNITGIDIDNLNNDCLNYFDIYFHYIYNSDKDKIIARYESSSFLRYIFFYMKRRLDTNISEIDEDSNYADYSRPRMIMKSGHDTTLIFDLFFFIKALDLNETEIYKYPQFASQLAIEIKANKDNCKQYSDYYVEGYYNNKTIFNISADVFFDKVENIIFTDEKLKDYCEIDQDDNTDNTDNTNNEKKSDTAKKAYKILMIIFICLSAIFLAIIIILAYQIYKLKKANYLQDNHNNTSNIAIKNN